jgi:hypothetical protein
MGIIHPPWISKKWFSECPFNYCDHFGDVEELALMCKICKEDIEWREKLKKEGKDPNDWGEVFKEVGKNFALTMAMVQEKAKEMGIDLSNVDEEGYEQPPSAARYKVFRIVRTYGDKVEMMLKSLEEVPIDTNIRLIMKARDVLSHSRSYAQVKIARALSSRWRERKGDEIEQEIADSKTSALFAYMAIDRNKRTFIRLARHRPLFALAKRFLKIAKISADLLDIVKGEFFPEDDIDMNEEFGCDSYNKAFP